MQISAEELELVVKILKENAPGVCAWAYGSRVNGTSRKFSDLDIVLLPKEGFDFNEYCKLKLAFEESDLPFSVDLHRWDRIPESFKQTIKASYEVLV